MLKGIPSILPPDLLKVLMEMGHGDELVIGDGNFPAARIAKVAQAPLLRCDGHSVPAVLEALMQLFPLDQYVPQPVFLMELTPQDRDRLPSPKRWEEYEGIIRCCEPGFGGFAMLERFVFYERAERACAVISTGDGEIYANIILKKGVL